MAMKEYFTFTKLQNWILTIRWFQVIFKILVAGGGSDFLAEMQPAYSTAPVDWAVT